MWRLVALVAAWLAASGTVAAKVPDFRLDPAWPKPLPHHWVLGEVSGIAVDAADNVWVVQRPIVRRPGGTARPAPPVIELDPAGNVVRAWGGPGKGYDWVGSVHGIFVDTKAYVWLAGNGPDDGQVLKFTRDGKFVLQIGHPGRGAGSGNAARLGRPTDLAVDMAANEVYVSDGYANRRVIVFDATTGAFKRAWGAYGHRPLDVGERYDPRKPLPGQFGRPVHCVVLAADRLLYVCDRTNDRIQVFRKNGTFVSEFRVAPATRGMGSVWDLALWPDAGQTLLFDADGQNERVHVLRRLDGAEAGSFGRGGRKPGEFDWVHSVAIDSHGDLFTTEAHRRGRVQRFVPDMHP